MVEITIENSQLSLKVEGADRLWSLKSHLSIPLEHITVARMDTQEASRWYDGLKMGGTGIPGVFKAGTYLEKDGRIFWDVRHPEKAVVIGLLDERYKELIVEVDDPQSVVAMINDAISRERSQ